MKSSIHLAALFLLALTLGACGGAEFSAAAEADDGLAGAAGDVDPGTGGTAGSGAGSSGQAGAGSGGAAAGAAGSSTAGSAGAGATGAGGEHAGGFGGEGGATEPTCTPEEAITTAALPESFTWDGFDGFWEGEDQDYCAYSDGGTCSTRNLGLSFAAEESTVYFHVFMSCTASFYSGPCGTEMACGTSIDPSTEATRTFTIEPAGNGYRLTFLRVGVPPELINRDACRTELPTGGYATPIDDARPDLADALFAPAERTYPCPGSVLN